VVDIGRPADYVASMKVRIALLLLAVAAAGYVTTTATAGAAIDPLRLGVLLLAGFLASAGASAMNAYLDRDIDALMARTRHRPLPEHRIEPPGKVLAFGAALSTVGIALAYVAINPLTAAFVALGAFVYLVVYTLGLKRRNEWNIVIGGFAGSCPALAGSAAAINAVSLPAALLALIVFLWTPGHFWSLAFRQREDYRRAGIPMLPATRGEPEAVRAITASTVIVVAVVILISLTAAFGLTYFLVAVTSGAVIVAVAARFARLPTNETAWAGYRASSLYLGAVLLGAIADALLRFRL